MSAGGGGRQDGGAGPAGPPRPDIRQPLPATEATEPTEPTEVIETDTAVATRRRLQRPRRYQVVFNNDDYTTMEFVVAMLMKHFRKPPAEAMHIMLLVHHKGAGVAGVYTRDVAETKVAEVTAEAREQGMPLLLTAEPQDADPVSPGGHQ
jgi:ATP-dependent Clp protease adaptor protein ClpS